IRHLFATAKKVELGEAKRMAYADAMRLYGNDKPELRFGMEFSELTSLAQHRNFAVFDSAELVVGICAPGAGEYSRKQLDEVTHWVKRQQIVAKGMVYV